MQTVDLPEELVILRKPMLGITAYKKGVTMMTSILYVGMDVHKENYTLCCYGFDEDKVQYQQKVSPDYKLVLKYLEQIRTRYSGEVEFVCGYEAGCLGYTLYHQLTNHGVKCVILAPTTMAITNKNRVRTDKRDAGNIARCLAFRTYSEVHVPTAEDESVESAQSYTRGAIGHKSKDLKRRQNGNTPEVIAYADKANERLRRKFYRLTLKNNTHRNVAATAIARELSCFMWVLMTDNVA
jgi:transposase